MSSDIIARVEAFSHKAVELSAKGHILRAAENYGRAAEAARALGEDNLVTVHMLLLQGDMFSGHSMNAADVLSADARSLATYRAECIALFSVAVDVLERRRVAGTLLEGKCTPAEAAWRAAHMQHFNTRISAAAMRAASTTSAVAKSCSVQRCRSSSFHTSGGSVSSTTLPERHAPPSSAPTKRSCRAAISSSGPARGRNASVHSAPTGHAPLGVGANSRKMLRPDDSGHTQLGGSSRREHRCSVGLGDSTCLLDSTLPPLWRVARSRMQLTSSIHNKRGDTRRECAASDVSPA